MRVLRVFVLLACGLLAFVAVPGRSASSRPAPVSSCAAGYVALTFDDGPSPTTPALLAALRDSGLRATMFDIGRDAAAHPELVRAQVRAGMWVENHTLTHPHLTHLDTLRLTGEIIGAQDVLRRLTGRAPTLLRPPFLESDARVSAVTRTLGLLEVFASVDSGDYDGASTHEIVAAGRRLQAGGIMLMHDWPPATIKAIPGIAATLAERGLCTGRIARSLETGQAVVVKP